MNKEFLQQMHHEFLNANLSQLEQVALSALNRGYKNTDFVVFCIDPKDKNWQRLIEQITPYTSWGNPETTAIVGIHRDPTFVEYICAVVPDVASAFDEAIPEGLVRVVTLTHNSANVRFIEPKPQYKQN